MAESVLMALAGALVGISVGLTGMGGGALMTPILVLLFGVTPTAAVGTDLTASVAMKPVGAAVHHRAGTVRWDIVRWLLPAGAPLRGGGAGSNTATDLTTVLGEAIARVPKAHRRALLGPRRFTTPTAPPATTPTSPRSPN